MTSKKSKKSMQIEGQSNSPQNSLPEGIFKTLMKKVSFLMIGALFLPDQYQGIFANPISNKSNKSNASIALTLLQKV